MRFAQLHLERQPHRQRGFTLIEVLLTMLLLSILLPVIMQALSVSVSAATSARRRTEAASLAQDQLNILISTGNWQSGGSGDFGTDHPGYRWTCQTAARDYGVQEVQLTVAWQEQSKVREFSVSTMVDTYTTGVQ
jgi:prepilin-type N-terminal cleavage/methylation domain-containing protein